MGHCEEELIWGWDGGEVAAAAAATEKVSIPHALISGWSLYNYHSIGVNICDFVKDISLYIFVMAKDILS